MLAIRLSRIGKKNSAFFRVVVMDKRKSAKGRAIEVLGSVNPHTKEINLKNERILHWIGVGAQPSDRVHNILVSKNVVKGPKIIKKVKRSKKTGEAAEEEMKDAGAKSNEAVEEIKTEKTQEKTDNNVETQPLPAESKKEPGEETKEKPEKEKSPKK